MARHTTSLWDARVSSKIHDAVAEAIDAGYSVQGFLEVVKEEWKEYLADSSRNAMNDLNAALDKIRNVQ